MINIVRQKQMPMKRYPKKNHAILCVSSFCLFFIGTTQTEVPFTWMHYIYAVTHPTYCHLSPIHGMDWAEQRTVDQMYLEGNPNSPTIKLIKELFYMQADNVSFRPTILKSKPASYWTPQDIGKIIAAITTYRQSTASKKDTENILHTSLENIMLPQKKLMEAQEKEIATHITCKKKILCDITQQHKNVLTRTGQAERKLHAILEKLGKQSEQLNQMHEVLDDTITEIEHLQTDHDFLAGARKPIEESINKLVYDRKLIARALQKGINDLANYFLDSVEKNSADDKEYPYQPYTTENILLVLLWKIANPQPGDRLKQDFVDYFNQLGAIVDADNLETWIAAPPYNKQDYLSYNGQIHALNPDMRKQYITQHPEQALLATVGYRVWESSLPPIIPGAGAIYTYSDGTPTEQSPDCTDTSFRNFFNLITYNHETHRFDIERFIAACKRNEDFPLQLNNNLIGFYQRYNCVTNLQASELYKAWTQVTSNLSDVVYMKPCTYAQHARFYEVKSFFPNMLALCNHLLFGNNALINQLPKDTQLDLICNTLSRDDFALSWDIVDTDIKKNALDHADYVTLKFFINDTHSFEWQLKDKHSVIPRLEIQKKDII